MILIKLIYTILLILGGIGLIKYRRNVKSWTGNFVWAEHYLGNGGTYLVIIIIGLGMIFYGTIYPFGGLEYLIGK